MNLPHGGTPYLPWTCPTAEQLSHRGPAPLGNTLLTVDLPHSGTPYSPWTCPTGEHPTHRGPAPPGNTLLTVDLPHSGTVEHRRTLQNTLLTLDQPHVGRRPLEKLHGEATNTRRTDKATYRLNWRRVRCSENYKFVILTYLQFKRLPISADLWEELAPDRVGGRTSL